MSTYRHGDPFWDVGLSLRDFAVKASNEPLAVERRYRLTTKWADIHIVIGVMD